MYFLSYKTKIVALNVSKIINLVICRKHPDTILGKSVSDDIRLGRDV